MEKASENLSNVKESGFDYEGIQLRGLRTDNAPAKRVELHCHTKMSGLAKGGSASADAHNQTLVEFEFKWLTEYWDLSNNCKWLFGRKVVENGAVKITIFDRSFAIIIDNIDDCRMFRYKRSKFLYKMNGQEVWQNMSETDYYIIRRGRKFGVLCKDGRVLMPPLRLLREAKSFTRALLGIGGRRKYTT